MAMKLSDLANDLQATLHDSSAVFKAPLMADFKRFLELALPDMQFKRPITRLGEVTLQEGLARYAMPASDFASMKTMLWGVTTRRRPWEPGYPGAVPRLHAHWDGGAWWLELESEPTCVQISEWGRTLSFWYFAQHRLTDADPETAEATTIAAQDRGLLLLRAQAEAMRELSMRNITKPVQLRDGVSGTPRNSTPAALFETLLELFHKAR